MRAFLTVEMFERPVIGESFGYVWSETVPLVFAECSLGFIGGGFGLAVPNINLDASTSPQEDLECKYRQIMNARLQVPEIEMQSLACSRKKAVRTFLYASVLDWL